MTTIKQRLVVKKIEGNGGNITKTMREVGYSENTIHSPQKLTRSKGWIQLMRERLNDDALTKAHEEALHANKQIGAQILIDANGKVINKENEGVIEVPDHAVRLKAVELGYKLKGKLSQFDNPMVAVQVNNNMDKLSDAIKAIAQAIQHGNTNTATG
jgi:hypothetical protein